MELYEMEERRARETMQCLTESQLQLIMDRARETMQCLTESQLQLIMDNYVINDKAFMVELLMDWRCKRGDFANYSDDDEDNAALNSLYEVSGHGDFVTLPHDLQGVNEGMLNDHFTKCDLQLECLLRNIQYQASDDKPILISKLMGFKTVLQKEEIRARRRTELLSDDQLQLIMSQCCLGDGHGSKLPQIRDEIIDFIITWRRNRGDFGANIQNNVDDYHVNVLPDDLQGVDMTILTNNFTLCDLQLESLLRHIPYKAGDDKLSLVMKLMDFKERIHLTHLDGDYDDDDDSNVSDEEEDYDDEE